MIVGLAVTLIGIFSAVAVMGQYTTLATTIYASCTTYPQPATCQGLYVQETTSLFWFFATLIPFASGLTAFLISFGRGPAIGSAKAEAPAAPTAGRVFCPTCKTWQMGAFCSNDGTKLG